jgi:hypothetical protein
MAQLIASNPTTPAVLVQGIIHQSAKTIIVGGSKAFKTWSFMNLSIAVATGTTWWDFQCEQGDTLYINFEIHDGFFAARFQEVCDAMGVDERVASEHFHYLGLRGHAADLTKLAELILTHCSERTYKLITIDPMYKCMGDRDENSAGQMADLMNVLDRISQRTGAAIVFGHHFSKGNQASKDMIDRSSGSSVFGRDPDTIIVMTPHEEPDAFIVEFRLRNFPPQEKFVVKRVHPLMIKTNELDSEDIRRPDTASGRGRGRPREFGDVEYTEILPAEGMTRDQWREAAMTTLDISASTFARKVRELVQDGLVVEQRGIFTRPPQ